MLSHSMDTQLIAINWLSLIEEHYNEPAGAIINGDVIHMSDVDRSKWGGRALKGQHSICGYISG